MGKVISVEDSGQSGQKARLKVIKSWKGVKEEQVTLSTRSADRGSCGTAFVVGEERHYWIDGNSSNKCGNAVSGGQEFLDSMPTLTLNTDGIEDANSDSKNGGSKEIYGYGRNFIIILIVGAVIAGFGLLILLAAAVFLLRKTGKGGK